MPLPEIRSVPSSVPPIARSADGNHRQRRQARSISGPVFDRFLRRSRTRKNRKTIATLSKIVLATGAIVLGSVNPTRAASFAGLGDLPGGSFFSRAFGVSSDGKVVVGWGESASSTEAFRWTSGGMVGLGLLPGGGSDSQAYGVSSDGSVVVVNGYSTSEFEAFRWTSGGMVGLGDLPGGSFNSEAFGVSSDGSVVVGQSKSANGREAFRWTSGGMVGLGDLPGGNFMSEAFGVSSDGQVVVGYGKSASGYEAFRWTSGGMVGLGDLPGGGFYSQAYGVSSDGSVVVGYGKSASGYEAFRWTSGGMRSVRDVLVNDFGLNLTGWQLSEATGVSADGLTIVGTGINPAGNTEAWIARLDSSTPPASTPEPSAAVALGLVSLLGLAARLARR